MTHRERRVPFDGATNFRDLGGYATTDGGQTHWGLVYRADGLHHLTAADVDRYASLGIRVVFDLRRDSERELRPNRVPSVDVCISTPVIAAGVVLPDRTTMTDHLSGERLLRSMYGNMLAHSGPVVGRIVGSLADPASVPAVFHCHAGKDRTGLVAALLLEALGVPRETVLDDYELTSQYWLPEHQNDSYDNLVAGGMAPEAAAAVLGAPRWAMADTLAELDDVFGGIEAYLRQRGGLTQSTIERLRRHLVEH